MGTIWNTMAVARPNQSVWTILNIFELGWVTFPAKMHGSSSSRRAGSHMANEPKFFLYKLLADGATRGCAKGLGELAKAILAVQDGAKLPMEKDLIPPFRMNENELSFQELTNFSSYDVVTLEKRLDSLTRPWLISLSNSGIPGQPHKRLILKPEDMGREACVMQTIVRFNHIWQERNLQVCGRVVCAKTYRIFPVAPDIGFVEFVMNSTTLQKLKRDSGSLPEVSNRCMQYLRGDDERLNQLAATTVGYLAICYLLGIGDGHGDNLMLTKDGELFRIDFGFLFGEKPSVDAPTLWLPETVQKALGQRLDDVIQVSRDAVRAVLERPNVNFLFSVFDAAFPTPSGEHGALQFLASLNPEDYDRQVVHFQDGSFGKAFKSFARKIGYGLKRRSTPALTINDKSPAALVFFVTDPDARPLAMAASCESDSLSFPNDARPDALVTPETLDSHVEPLVDAPHVQDVQAQDLFDQQLLAVRGAQATRRLTLAIMLLSMLQAPTPAVFPVACLTMVQEPVFGQALTDIVHGLANNPQAKHPGSWVPICGAASLALSIFIRRLRCRWTETSWMLENENLAYFSGSPCHAFALALPKHHFRCVLPTLPWRCWAKACMEVPLPLRMIDYWAPLVSWQNAVPPFVKPRSQWEIAAPWPFIFHEVFDFSFQWNCYYCWMKCCKHMI